MTSTDAEMAESLGRLDTPALSDALDRYAIVGQCVGLDPISRSNRLVGRAYTVRMLPRGLSGKSVGDYIDDVPPGAVVVIDNAGRLDATVWGDILTTIASRRGVGGTVIDGVCRDVDRALEDNYPIYSRAVTMRTGKDRVSAEAYGEPVQLAGVRVEAGDWIVGDADGVVAIPYGYAATVVAAAQSIAATEHDVREIVASGGRLDDARRELGYHQLQAQATLQPEIGSTKTPEGGRHDR